MIEGYCVPCRKDSPSTPDRRCADCGHILIPPSWARRDTPYPWPERPEGWSWSSPKEDEPKKAPQPKASTERTGGIVANTTPGMVTCSHCSKEYESAARGYRQTRFCSTRCKERARKVKGAQQRAAAFQPYPCEQCATLITAPPKNGGPPRRFCGTDCRRAWWATRREGVAA